MNRLRKGRTGNLKGDKYFHEEDVKEALEILEEKWKKELKKYEGALLVSREKRIEGAKQTKLNENDQNIIYMRYTKDGENVSRLAREYKVSRGTILNYIKRVEKKVVSIVKEESDLNVSKPSQPEFVSFDISEITDEQINDSQKIVSKISSNIEE